MFSITHRFNREQPHPRSSIAAYAQVAATLAIALFSAAVIAQPSQGAAQRSVWGVGVGAGTTQSPYKLADDRTVGLPLLIYESAAFSVAGTQADFKLYNSESVSLRIRGRIDPALGYEADDSPALVGMDERKFGVWLGAAAVWRTGIVDLGVELLGDPSSRSKGQRATLSVQRRFDLGQWALTPKLEAQLLDKKYTNYYFGVLQSEAITGRAFYEPGSTTNTRLGLRVDYMPRPRHSLFFDAGVTQFGSEIKDSPIVGRSSQTSAFLGYVYLF